MKVLGDKLWGLWERTRRFCLHSILHADDPPHKLALGIAIGMFVTFTPTIGFQMGIVFFLAWLFRANKLVGVPLVWISNPATLVPVYYPCYWVGCKLMGESVAGTDWITSLVPAPGMTYLQILQLWGDKLLDIAAPLWLGCIVVGGALGVLSYYISLFFIRSYRLRRWGQLLPPSEVLENLHEEGANRTENNPSITDRSSVSRSSKSAIVS